MKLTHEAHPWKPWKQTRRSSKKKPGQNEEYHAGRPNPAHRGWTPLGRACLSASRRKPHTPGVDRLSWGSRRGNRGKPRTPGVDRELPIQRGSPDCKPRERGGGPMRDRIKETNGRANPAFAGWTGDAWIDAPLDTATPTHAGVDRRYVSPGLQGGSKSRERRGGPVSKGLARHMRRQTPPARGWTPSPLPQVDRQGANPANARVAPALRCVQLGQERKPRERGGGPDWLGASRGSSPTPAPAGVDLDWARLNGQVVGKPRTRGGRPRQLRPGWNRGTQTPHPRGWTSFSLGSDSRPAATPDPAGVDR